MKKRFVFAATALFTVGALAMLTGCGGKTGEISGKYKEATPEEVAAACEKYQFDRAFGNVEKDDWTFNLQAEGEMKSKFDIAMNMKMDGGMTTSMTCKLSGSESFDYLVSLAQGESGVSTYGAGNVKGKSEGAISMSGISISLDYNEEWKVYHDNTAVYVDPVKDSKIFLTKSKIALDEIMDDVEDEIPSLPQAPGFPTQLEKPEEFKAMIDELVANGVKISLDQRKGLKMKFSIGKEMAEKMMAQQGEQEGVQAEIEFKTFEVDLYVSLDENGMFEAAGIVFDINIEMSVATVDVGMAGTIVLEGGYSLKATGSTAKLPAGIATDSSYQPFDMDSLLGGMGGIGGLIGAGSKYPV